MSIYQHNPIDESSDEQQAAFSRNPLDFLLKLAREHGDIAPFQLGSQRAFLLNHPDYIKDVLVTHQENFLKARAPLTRRLLGEGLLTSDGAFHQRQRRLVQPAFHRQRIANYGTVMTDYGAHFAGRWKDGETFDVAREMMSLMLAIVGKTLFDADVERDTMDVGGALGAVRELFEMPPARADSDKSHKASSPLAADSFQQARERLDAIIYRIINERRQSGTDRGDLISMLLLAQEESDGARMTDEQVRDEAMTLFLAGHETTSDALSWSWHLLAQHPEVEAKLHAELDAVLAGRLPTIEDAAQLVYTEMVFAEVLRLYPPAWRISRWSVEEHEIGDHLIPADSLILLSQYVTHRDARYFPEPLRFDPERWTPQAREARPAFAYFPFGGGTRRCIGEGFARTAGILLLATLASRWRLRLAAGCERVETEPLLTLRPKREMQMTAHRR